MYVHSSFRFRCEKCFQVLKAPAVARSHRKKCLNPEKSILPGTSLISDTLEATIKCQFCGDVFNNMSLFESHIENHKTETVNINNL